MLIRRKMSVKQQCAQPLKQLMSAVVHAEKAQHGLGLHGRQLRRALGHGF